MGRLDAWLFCRIVRKEVRQGYTHDKRITAMFREIIEAAQREFHEDNDATIGGFLCDRFGAARPMQRRVADAPSGVTATGAELGLGRNT